ncbi:hypothetical protein GTQ99_05755 [Kineococcus sp. T13]|uniref:FG-GAP repeat domain-containing protein n=1 Tax=Kineococcus vitellinus TaxID=2696565 RepID=UPI001411FD69|nr:VCBS repeat-containing protein [Kineococcus vitellinus]NAZ74929.1 hypothetical protein [Kineococcus vitellinus]
MLTSSDFDDDGHAELVVSSATDLGLLQVSGSTLTATARASSGTWLGGWNLQVQDNRFGPVGDFDGDHRAELVVSSPWGLGILERQGGELRPLTMAANGTRLGEWNLQTGDNRFEQVLDLDGDGRDGLLVTSPWGLGLLGLGRSGLSSHWLFPNGTRLGGWNLQTGDNRFGPAGDLDGDGRDEVLVSSPWGVGVLDVDAGSPTVVAMAANGTRLGGRWNLQTGDNRFRLAGDVDGDGREEVLVTSPWGIGVLALRDGALVPLFLVPNGTRLGEWVVDTASNRFGPLADLDGDGRAELFVSSPWGVGVLEWNGSGLTSSVMAANGARVGEWVVDTRNNRFGRAADYDGDGRAEVLASSPWGVGLLKQSGSTFSTPVMAANGTNAGGWRIDTDDDRYGVRGGCADHVTVHTKTLVTPTAAVRTFLHRQFTEAEQLFADVGIALYRGSLEDLSADPALAHLVALDVGTCTLGAPTAEHVDLYAHRAGVAADDLVVYLVQTLVGGSGTFAGCATHPAGQPGAAIVQAGARWLLAHELGHVLGLRHPPTTPATNADQLMWWTTSWTNTPPDLAESEVSTLLQSLLTHPV